MFDFYHFSDKTKQMFYKNLILFVFGEELKIKTPHEFSSIKFKCSLGSVSGNSNSKSDILKV